MSRDVCAMRIALITSTHVDPAKTDDRLLHAALVERGYEVDWLAWDDPAAQWHDYDCVLLRSCWGYHQQSDEFRAWVEACAKLGVELVNTPDMVLHNMHKHYLLELEAAGVPVPPLQLLRKGVDVDLRATLATLGCATAVIKPAISGTAWQTWRVQDIGVEASQKELQGLLRERDMLVQSYEPSVELLGEWSLVFLGGVYSHAALKLPKAGDFRSQANFGGSVRFMDAPLKLKSIAKTVISNLGSEPVYARVDMIESLRGPLLMEVELIEPVLYFAARPGAASDLIAHLERRISTRPRMRAHA